MISNGRYHRPPGDHLSTFNNFWDASRVLQARRKGSPRELHLGDVDAAFLLIEVQSTKSKPKEDEQAVVNKVSDAVDKILTDAKLEEILAPSTASEAEMEDEAKADPETESSRHVGALDEITFDLRFSLADQWERSVTPF